MYSTAILGEYQKLGFTCTLTVCVQNIPALSSPKLSVGKDLFKILCIFAEFWLLQAKKKTMYKKNRKKKEKKTTMKN